MPSEPHKKNVAANRLVGRRLAKNPKKPELLPPEFEGGPHRFLFNAFYDARGDLSVDVFWEDQKLSFSDQKSALNKARLICVAEGGDICGWSSCKVGHLLEKTSAAVSGVVHSPTETNENHADILRIAFLRADSMDDPHRSNKSKMFAVALKDYFNQYGKFVGTE